MKKIYIMLHGRKVSDFRLGEMDFPPVQHTILFSRFPLKKAHWRTITFEIMVRYNYEKRTASEDAAPAASSAMAFGEWVTSIIPRPKNPHVK